MNDPLYDELTAQQRCLLYIMDELPEHEREAFELEMKSHPELTEFVGEYSSMIAVMGEMDESVAISKVQVRSPWQRGLAVAAAIAATVLLIVFWNNQSTQIDDHASETTDLQQNVALVWAENRSSMEVSSFEDEDYLVDNDWMDEQETPPSWMAVGVSEMHTDSNIQGRGESVDG